MAFSLLVVAFLATIITLVVIFIKKHIDYFKNKNVPFLRSFPLAGAFVDIFLNRIGIYQVTEQIYKNPKFKNEPFFGIFVFHKPALFITDPELIKNILVKDFNQFANRHTSTDTHDEIGNSTLFTIKNPTWRNVRRKISPFFTSAKMKSMFQVFDKISDDLITHIDNNLDSKNEIILKNALSSFTMDVIASCAFGVDANGLMNPKSEFVRNAAYVFDFTFKRGLEFMSGFLLPEITKLFDLKMFSSKGSDFIMRTIKHVMSERERMKIKKNDLIDTLIEINNSPVADDEEKLSLEVLVAQAGVFFIAGYETSSVTASFALYELAKNKNIQNQLREEIEGAIKKNNGQVTYDSVMESSSYLQQVVQETLRLYPVVPFLDRECSNPNGYSLQPFSKFVVPFKMPIYIPCYPMQRDEKYFENPLKFDPERFSKENSSKIPSFVHLPFGIGPRNCIGERFGLMQTKIAIIKILMKYRVELSPETPTEMKLSKNALLIQPETPIKFKLIQDEMKL